MKPSPRVLASLGHQELGMRVEIDLLSERLDDGHNTRHEFCAGCGPEVFEDSLDGRPAKFLLVFVGCLVSWFEEFAASLFLLGGTAIIAISRAPMIVIMLPALVGLLNLWVHVGIKQRIAFLMAPSFCREDPRISSPASAALAPFRKQFSIRPTTRKMSHGPRDRR